MSRLHAYCYLGGVIEFGAGVPRGCLPVARGEGPALRAAILATAKRGTDGALIVPGLPEDDPEVAVDLLAAYGRLVAIKLRQPVVPSIHRAADEAA